MAKALAHTWTVEKLSALELARLKVVRENASRNGVADLVAMCDSAIELRKPAASARSRKATDREIGDLVTEYHFICQNDRGVKFNSDGTFWSTSWVVAEEVLQKSMRYGAKLALHSSKAESSYRQGTIRDYQRIDDFAEGAVEFRIDFLVAPDDTPLVWAGSGAGEKRAKSSGMRAIGAAIESETK
jgi:hypothetical protein